MKYPKFFSFPLVILLLTSVPALVVRTTWFVDGVNGNDSNNCLSPTTACKTSDMPSRCRFGDTIMVASAKYTENLTIGINLNMVSSGAPELLPQLFNY